MQTTPLIITASCGLAISLYATYVKHKLNTSPKYHPICDINNTISCSKALNDKQGKLFLISNTIWGIILYATLIPLAILNTTILIQPLAIAAVLASLYLAYVSFFRIKVFCLVCNATYIINALILIFALI